MRTNIKALAQNIDSEILEQDWNLFNLVIKIGNLDTSIGGLTHRKDVTSLTRLGKLVQERDTLAARAAVLRACIGRLEGVANDYRWNRAWIVVTNGKGHVHKTTSCTTCYATTRFQLLPQCSALTESEIVWLAGERACTICYPSAPVASRDLPTQLFSIEEEQAQAIRAEQVAKRNAKEAKKVTALVEGRPQTFGTIRSALIEAGGDYARAIIAARYNNEDWKGIVEAKLKDVESIVRAVAAHPDAKGTTFEALFTEMEIKAKKKYLAEVKKFGTLDASNGWYISANDAVHRVVARADAIDITQ